MFKLFPNSRESKLNWARLCVNEHLEINHVCLCTINTCYYIFKSHSYIHIPMLSNNVPLLYVIMRIWWCHVFVPMEIHSRCCSQRRGSSVEGTCAGGGGVQRRDCRLGMFKHKGFGGEIYGNISGISWDIYIYQWVDDRMTSLWLFNITEHGWAWPIEIDEENDDYPSRWCPIFQPSHHESPWCDVVDNKLFPCDLSPWYPHKNWPEL